MSQSKPNPFRSPSQMASQPAPSEADSGIDFGQLARKWEVYRIFYNAILVVWTLLLLGLGAVVDGVSVFVLLLAIPGAAAANFFFFLGPAFDGYCQWIFGSQWQGFGIGILILGTLFTMALVAGCFL